MSRTALRYLLAFLAMLVPIGAPAQELSPMIVEGPRISRTAFTNWESIELAYTVRWLDGYEPVRSDLTPQSMNFGMMELDQDFADESDIRNERKFESENFFDIVYHLRYMGEKKGEIIVPGQRFPYRSLTAGDSQVHYFQTPEFKLKYDTVLTSGADDIKEELDLGSYQETATLWKLSALAVILAGVAGGFVLVLFGARATALSGKEETAAVAETAEKVLEPASIIRGLQDGIAKKNMPAVCNGLTDLIRAYVPDIGPGTTSKDMVALIQKVPHAWERHRLLLVYQVLRDIEEYLFALGGTEYPAPALKGLDVTVRELAPASVYWRRRLFNLKRRVVRPFLKLKALIPNKGEAR